MNTPVSITEELKQSLRVESDEAEAQRRDLLRGRRFLFVMGSYPGKRHMYEHAREMGASLVVLDGPGHWTKDAVAEGLFEGFIEVDLFPTETVAERALAAIQATGLTFDGVGTFEDLAGPLTALLAEALGLPGHAQLAIGFSRNKIFTREVCMEAGIPSPRFIRIKSTEDLAAAAAHVGFPAVLKPISGVSSVATYFVKDEDTLRQRYQQTIESLVGHLKTTGIHSDDENELVWAKGFDMTLEEYLDGEEFDVDVLLSEGEMVYASVCRDMPQPLMKETGSQMPPDFPMDKQSELIELTGQVLRALEFTDGSFHVESKYTSNGPRLIEVNARIGGLSVYELHRRVWGVDLVEQYLLTRMGIPIRPQKSPQPLNYLITSYLPAPYSGTIAHTDYLDPIVNHPQVIKAKPKVKAGQYVIGPDKGIPDLLGEVMVCGDSVGAASQSLDEILPQIELPIVRQ
jgi:carnosine synthase